MTTRQQNGEIGEAIVTRKLQERGWTVENANEVVQTNCPNYDLIIKKDFQILRVQVKSKKHKSKTTLCGSWKRGERSFNKSDDFDKAEFLVMVRFMDDEDDVDCFVLPISEAERLTVWFGEEVIKLGNKPVQLQPYVSKTPRKSKFGFNNRDVWENFSEAWSLLDNNTSNKNYFP
jgi:hypothetical protein